MNHGILTPSEIHESTSVLIANDFQKNNLFLRRCLQYTFADPSVTSSCTSSISGRVVVEESNKCKSMLTNRICFETINATVWQASVHKYKTSPQPYGILGCNAVSSQTSTCQGVHPSLEGRCNYLLCLNNNKHPSASNGHRRNPVARRFPPGILAS